jgi:hypothetical protein
MELNSHDKGKYSHTFSILRLAEESAELAVAASKLLRAMVNESEAPESDGDMIRQTDEARVLLLNEYIDVTAFVLFAFDGAILTELVQTARNRAGARKLGKHQRESEARAIFNRHVT